jgi:glycosyltransferase involved in cell wall biosynthesis
MWTGGTGGIETLAINYSNLSKQDDHYIFIHRGGEIAEEMIRQNKKVTILSSTSVFARYKEIKEYVRNKQIDVVISHHGVDYLWLYLKWVKHDFPSVKTIIYAHSYYADKLTTDVKGIRTYIAKIIFYSSYKTVDGMIAISNAVKNGLININISSPEKIEVIYNGVDVRKFKSNIEISAIPQIIYVGRLEYVKGVHKLIDALAKVSCDFRCIIVGEGSQKEKLENQAREYGLLDKVSFLGRRNDVDALLQKADIFVHPAIWNEGFGISLVEAMSTGLVCITFNKGAMKEIIDDGLNGYIVEPDTSGALATKLEDVINNLKQGNLAEVRQNAVMKAHSFSIDKYVSSFNELVERI